MTGDMYTRTADDLSRAFRSLGAPNGITASDDGVTIPWRSATALLSRLAFVEGGSRVPFVRSLLRCAPGTDIFLRGDEGMHLRRALEDVERENRRREKLDRGQIPGALRSSEVVRLARRHPHLFS